MSVRYKTTKILIQLKVTSTIFKQKLKLAVHFALTPLRGFPLTDMLSWYERSVFQSVRIRVIDWKRR